MTNSGLNFLFLRRSLPTWLKLSSEDVKEQIYKLAKKGLTPSQIGVILRDSHGVAQVIMPVNLKIDFVFKSRSRGSISHPVGQCDFTTNR